MHGPIVWLRMLGQSEHNTHPRRAAAQAGEHPCAKSGRRRRNTRDTRATVDGNHSRDAPGDRRSSCRLAQLPRAPPCARWRGAVTRWAEATGGLKPDHPRRFPHRAAGSGASIEFDRRMRGTPARKGLGPLPNYIRLGECSPYHAAGRPGSQGTLVQVSRGRSH